MGVEITNKTTLRLCNEWLKKQETPKLSTLIEKVIEVGKVDNIETIIKPKEPLTFSELFKPEYRAKIKDLISTLKSNNYIDDKGNWREYINSERDKIKGNEPAAVYSYLRNNTLLFDEHDKTNGLKSFYLNFGIVVNEKLSKTDGIREITRKNISVKKLNRDEEKHLNQVFSLFLSK